ncbi:hypothetical protein [Crossiella cryophila]|uniref:Pycsar effector protein domain-containing protein n=1 Tax=Crossiella cryophila TaxID=43355 RepID=A0A7W7C520_9PSEU|nr:hypothetical protein [Crossiella cryophila]MBB4674625.1 hypothetical protein [Crossiella cryophila]
MFGWTFSRRGSEGRAEAELPPGRPTSSTHLAPEALLELVRWHLDRYDRLRASTSTRASILLTAGSVLFTGLSLLITYRLQTRDINPVDGADIAVAAVGMVTILLNLASILSCIGAIAARKTSRAVHDKEIPPRFLFNWGDTHKSADGYTSFAQQVSALTHASILGHGIAELWTATIQHRDRHRYLRAGIRYFRYALTSFGLLTALLLVTALV